MSTREAARPDRPAIRDVARRSIRESYSFGPEEIVAAIRDWYGEDQLAGKIDAGDRLLLVTEREQQVVGFSESALSDGGETATLLWLHVDPAYRGEGFGDELFEATRERLGDRGARHVDGRVLDDNEDGNAFYEQMGYVAAGDDEVEIAGETYVEKVWTDPETAREEAIEIDDRTVYVRYGESDAGSKGDFFTVYADEDRTEQFGYFCGNCRTLANSMDSMGRIECDECGNARKATRWDAAYL